MSSEDRKIRALEGIKNYLGDLVRVMEATNKNLVEFAKIIQPKNEITTVDPAHNHIAQPEGYAGGIDWTGYPKKEGE